MLWVREQASNIGRRGKGRYSVVPAANSRTWFSERQSTPSTNSPVEPHRLMVASDDRNSDDRVGVRTEEADHVPKQDSADPAPLELRVDVQIRDLSGLLHRFMSTGTVMSKPNKSPSHSENS